MTRRWLSVVSLFAVFAGGLASAQAPEWTIITLFDTNNSPLPYGLVPGVAARDDGFAGLSSVW